MYTVHVPEYRVDREPDHRAVGRVVDAEIKRHFMGRTVLVRGISLEAHPGKTFEDMAAIIARHGTDRYDPTRRGDRYENIENKHINLFAFRRKVTPRMELFRWISWGFYHGSLEIHGRPTRIDVLLVYRVDKLKAVLHRYEGRDDKKRDGYAFREPDRKRDALLGLVHLTS